MLNYEITSIAGKHKARKRIGRGSGSGHGKTSGRGHKGAGSRAGAKSLSPFEGGQMPLFRRIPKRGFSNAMFATTYEIVNVARLQEVFESGSTVGLQEMINAGLISNVRTRVKVLGDGELSKNLKVSAHKFSKSAEQKIVSCGGTVETI